MRKMWTMIIDHDDATTISILSYDNNDDDDGSDVSDKLRGDNDKERMSEGRKKKKE